MKIAVIVNPNAGRANRRANDASLRRAIESTGAEATFHYTQARGDATRIAASLSGDVDIVGVMGGDGTIHETVNGLLPSDTPLFVYPCGAGNDLASLVSCPRTPDELAGVLRGGMGAALDVLRFGDRFCVNSAGLGFEGMVNRYSQTISRVRGHTRYMLALFKSLKSHMCPHFEISLPGGEKIDGKRLLVSVGNGNRTGGAFYMNPDAVPDDGLLDVCIVDPMNRIRMMGLLPRSLSGSHPTHPKVRMIRAKSLSIKSDGWYPMHIDGEYHDGQAESLDISVVPGALRVLCKEAGPNKLHNKLKKLV